MKERGVISVLSRVLAVSLAASLGSFISTNLGISNLAGHLLHSSLNLDLALL